MTGNHGMSDKHLASTAFTLGVMLTRRVEEVGGESTLDERLDIEMQTLQEIAEGKFTFFSGAADLTAPSPNMDAKFRELVFRNANEVMRQEREAAKLVWASMQDTNHLRTGRPTTC